MTEFVILSAVVILATFIVGMATMPRLRRFRLLRMTAPVLAPPADDGRFEQFAQEQRIAIQALQIETKVAITDIANAVADLAKTVQDYVIDFTDARRIELERHDVREKAWTKTLAVVDGNLAKLVTMIEASDKQYAEAMHKWKQMMRLSEEEHARTGARNGPG